MPSLTRRNFLLGSAVAFGTFAMGGLSACGGSTSGSASGAASAAVTDPAEIIFAWEPSNSGTEYVGMRDAFCEAIGTGAGIPCKPMTTADYNVTIEALSSGKAHMASLGASEYVEIHKKNPKIEVAFVLSDKEGKLNQVSYYSQVLCREEDVDKYKDASGNFSIDNIKGCKYSFVSTSSTSGFVIPATVFVGKFGMSSTDDFTEPGKFFSTVVMAGSQPLSVYQLASGAVDLCSCDTTSSTSAYTVVSGNLGEVGTVYEVKEGEGEFAKCSGQRLVCAYTIPVPAVPFCVNTEYVSAETIQKIVDYMCSSEVADNRKIFKDPNDADTTSKWKHSSDKICFVPADDSYYDDYRKLVGA